MLLAQAHCQGLDTADDQVGRERVQRRTVDFPVVPHLGHQHLRAAHHPTQHVTMPGQKLGCAVHHHIHAQRQRVLVQWRGKGVVGHHQRPHLVRSGAQPTNVQHLQRRVGGGFQVKQVATGGNLALQRFSVQGIAQAHLHAHARQELFEDLVGAAIAVAGRHHALAVRQEGVQHGTDGRHAAAERDCRLGLLQFGQFCFQRGDRGVAHAAVDEARLLALRHVVPGIDIVIAISGADHDRGLRGVVRVLYLLPAPHDPRPHTGRSIALDFFVVVHIRFPPS